MKYTNYRIQTLRRDLDMVEAKLFHIRHALRNTRKNTTEWFKLSEGYHKLRSQEDILRDSLWGPNSQ